MVDNFKRLYDLSGLTQEKIAALCHRRFGIGADGLIILEPSQNADFTMVYYNSDGAQSSMCGNGGRCILAMAHHLGYITSEADFEAIDGMHKGRVSEIVEIQLKNVNEIFQSHEDYMLDTGSPHYVRFVENIEELNIIPEAHSIRYNDKYKNDGINVNFVEHKEGRFFLRTYERGVENETMSCGTGVTATAIAIHEKLPQLGSPIKLNTPGGTLEVSFDKNDEGYVNIWLKGPTEFVFEGSLEI